MSPSTLHTAPAPKAFVRSSAPLRATGVITKQQGPADELKLVMLNALGDVVGESTRPAASDMGLVALNFPPAVVERAGKEPYFIIIKGYVKGALSWEQRLGRFQF